MSEALGVAAAEGVRVCEDERENKKGAPAAALRTPPSPNGWRQAADVSLSSSVTASSSHQHCAGDGKNNPSSSRRCTSGSSSTSSHAASHTSSHYIFAIQRDLEAIVSLQQLQLQAKKIPIPSQGNGLRTAPMGLGGHRLESTLAKGRQDRISAIDYADPAMHMHSIDHAKKRWLEAQCSVSSTLSQKHSRKELHQTCHVALPPEPAGFREATVSDTALQLPIGSWKPSHERAEDNCFSLAPHDVSGASIPAMHLQQLEPQSAPPPPPSASPIPASLVEYQRYLMQLEYQQRQHREVLRRHRRQRRKETISSAPRGAAPMSVFADTTTPPRQRIGAGGMGKDRRDRSPPLAMMMKVIRQRRGGDCGLHSGDMLDGETSSSRNTSVTASSVTPRRYRHSQKRSYFSTASPPTATAAPSRHRSGGRRASVSHGRGGSVGEGAGASATTMEKVPVVALVEEPVHSRYHQGHLQPQRWQKTGVQGSVNNNRPLPTNQQKLLTTTTTTTTTAATKKNQKSSHLSRHMTPLRVTPPSRSATLEPTPIDPALHSTGAAAAWHNGQRSPPPVEAFADALLMDVGGSPGVVVNDASTAAPPQVAMVTAKHVATAVGGTATVPAPILLTTTTTATGAPVMPPCEVNDDCLSEAEMAPVTAEDDKMWPHGSSERQKHMRGMGHPTSDTNTTTTTPVLSAHLSPSQERGLRAVSAGRGAGMRPKRGGATPTVTSTLANAPGVLRHPGTRATAHSGDRQRPRSAEPTLAHGNNQLHRRVTRPRSPGAGATIPAAHVHPALTDAYNTQRYHHHRHHHRSMEGISSTTPEHGTGTPRSSRYRYKSSSTTRQRKHPRQSLKHPPCHPNGVETSGDGHVGAIKHSVDATIRRKDSRAHRWASSPERHTHGVVTATRAFNSPKKSGGAVGRSANLRPPQASRSAAAIWRDVQLMWAPAPVAQAPFAAVYRYRPRPCPSTPFQVQRPHSPLHWDAPSSATAEATDNSARGHPLGLALGADETGKQAPRTLARREGVTHCALSPSFPATPQTLQRKISAGAPPQCMTDSLIGAALQDVVPVCRARQREVAREVTRRRYQLLSTDVGGTVASVRVY